MSNPDDPSYYADPSATTDGNSFIGEMNAADGVPSGAGNKYLFLSVPGFTEQPLHPNVASAMGGAIMNSVDINCVDSNTALGTFSGSAFLMIGSNPNMVDWQGGGTLGSAFTNGLTLARLAGDPMAMAISENLVVTNGVLSGNMDNPVGATLGWSPNPDLPYPQQQEYSSLPGSSPTESTFADSYVDGGAPVEGNPWTGTAFGTAQDPNFLLGYADDTRWRGIPETDTLSYSATNGLSTNNNLLAAQSTLVGNQQVANVNPNRMAESLKLLTKGGWWDHSDGNHISTTMGDKLEVVQGNYKLVILGRQPAPTPPPVTNTVNVQQYINDHPTKLLPLLNTWYAAWATATSPITAGVTAANYSSGGDLTSIAALVGGGAIDETGTAFLVVQKFAYQVQVWLMTQNSFITDVSGGHFQEQYPSPTPCIKTIEYSQDNNNEWTLYQDNAQGNLITRLKGRTVDLFEGESRETYVGSGNPDVLYASGSTAAAGGTGASGATDLRLDPMIASYTWAQSVYTQLGSPNKFIGNGPASLINPSSKGSSGFGPQPSTSTGGFPVAGAAMVQLGDVVSKTWAQRVATYIGSYDKSVNWVYSETHANQVESQTIAGTITSTQTAATITSTNTAINNFDFTIGLKESVQLGNQASLFVGATESLYIGATASIYLGWKLDLLTARTKAYASETLVGIEKVAATATKSQVDDVETHITAICNRVGTAMNEIRLGRVYVGDMDTRMNNTDITLATFINTGL